MWNKRYIGEIWNKAKSLYKWTIIQIHYDLPSIFIYDHMHLWSPNLFLKRMGCQTFWKGLKSVRLNKMLSAWNRTLYDQHWARFPRNKCVPRPTQTLWVTYGQMDAYNGGVKTVWLVPLKFTVYRLLLSSH